ncbi:MAG: polyprenyl synthetase family protein [Candidatus Lernaella stagnicola]|nr:polyprenyl synthetase family protein [Candidatus Lernaella stagnicola]
MTNAPDTLAGWLNEVERLVAEAGNLREWIAWTNDLPELQLGGKRLRARLLHAVASGLGVVDDRAAILAAAIEMVHNASLFHDDVIDNAALRRGQPALHTNNGARFAIMTGDLCFARAMQLLTRLDNLTVYRRVGKAVVDLAAGQLAESVPVPPSSRTLDHYNYIVDRKTGSLISLSVGLPGVLAELAPEQQEQLFQAGILLGRAFQIADDMLDLAFDTDQTGKDVLRDLNEGKLTFPYLLLMEIGTPEQRQRLLAELGNGDTTLAAPILALARETDLIAKVSDHLENSLKEVERLFKKIPEWSDNGEFFQLCRTIAFRTR